VPTCQSAPGAVQAALSATNPRRRGLTLCERYLIGQHRQRRRPYNGATFHEGWMNSPNVITTADMQSLKALSIGRVVRRGGAQLRAFGHCGVNTALGAVPVGASLRTFVLYSTHCLGRCSCANGQPCCWAPCLDAWNAVRTVQGFGSLVAPSKLLARKRLGLFPIYDARIARRLHIGTGQRNNYSIWATFQKVVQDDRVWANLTTILTTLRQHHPEVPTIQGLTELRVLDICLWMLP
jgi:hypothetical protein